MLRAFLFVCALASHAMAEPKPVLDKLEKNAELNFSIGFNLVAREPELLFWIAADQGASVDSIHALGKQVDEVKKTKAPALEIRKGEIFENGKPTGVRIVAYSPKLTLRFRGQHWTFDPKATLEANFESVQKFMRGKGSSAQWLGALLPYADASDAVGNLSPSVTSTSGWRTAAIVGGAAVGIMSGGGAGLLAGTAVRAIGARVGTSVGATVGGASLGAGGNAATSSTDPVAAATSVCEYIKSVEGDNAIKGLQEVEYSCTNSAKSGTSLEKTLNLEFRNGPRNAGISIDFKADAEKCCEVYLTQQPSVKLGKISQATWSELQEDTAGCARPITIHEARPRTKKAYETLRAANGFCKDQGKKAPAKAIN